MLNLLKKQMKNFNVIHSELFECNNYNKYNKFLNLLNKDDSCKILYDCEKLHSDVLFELSGKILIKIEDNLSTDLFNTDIGSITINDFKYLPFNYFQIDTQNIDYIKKIFISKMSGKIYFHLEEVGNNNISIQFVLSEKGLFAQYTHSSLYYHKEIQPISDTTKILCQNALKYIISVIFYLISFQNNSNRVVKDTNYENYIKKLSSKQLSKPKIQKKLKNKSDTVILKFDTNSSDLNSLKSKSKQKKVSSKFLVKGHWRNQRIGTRKSYQTTRKWIKPYFKGVNNDSYKNKIYKVS